MGIIKSLFSFGSDLESKSVTLRNTIPQNPLYEPFKYSQGNRDNIKSYEENTDAYSVLRKVTDVFKGTPWIVEQRQSDGSWEEITDTSIHELMDNPNFSKGYTWQDIDEQTVVYLFSNGNSYMVGQELNGIISEVDVLPSDKVEVTTSKDFFMPSPRYKFELNTNKKTFDSDEIEHIMMFNPSYDTVTESFKGLSVFDVARMAIEVGDDRWKADSVLMKNNGVAGLLTDRSDRPMSSEEAVMVQKGFNNRHAGVDKFGKVNVTNKNLDYIQMGMSSVNLELVKKGVITLRTLCNVLGLDSSLFNDPANKTFNNRKEAEKAMYTNAIIPLAEKIAAKHTRYIAKNHFPDGRVRMRKDFSEVPALQQDLKSEAEKDKIVIDGINSLLSMPISDESKKMLLRETYDVSEDFIDSIETSDPVINDDNNFIDNE